MESSKLKRSDDWIKVQSKSRPGRYYMFNKATGETKWIPTDGQANDSDSPTKKEKSREISPPPRISAPKPSKTPAQDRLKRLQHEIKLEQIKKQHTKSARRSAPELESKSKILASSKEYGKNCSPTKAQAFVKEEQKNSLLQMPTDSKEQQENLSLSKRSADSKDQQKNLSRKRSVESNKQLEHPLLSKKVAYSKDQQNNLLNGPVPDKPSISTSNAQLGHPLLSKRHSKDGSKNVSHESGTNNLSTSSAKQPPLEHTLLSKRNSKEEQHNLSVESDADEPSTSSLKSKQNSGQSPRTTRSSPRSSKRPRRTSVNQEIGDQLDYTPTKSPCLVESSNANISNTIDEDYEMANCESFATQSVPNAKEVDNSKNSMSLSSIGTGIVNKIKDFCKLPFRTSKSHENKVITRNTTTFKPPKKTENVPKIASAAIKLGLNELKEEQTKIAKNDLNRSAGILYSTPTNSISPAYQRGSANSRLERLRQSLFIQQEASASSSDSGNKAKSLGMASPGPPSTLELNNSNNSVFHSASNTIDDEPEAMDWQPTVKEEAIEISSSESSLSLLLPATIETKVETSSRVKNVPETMADIYDAVNENLLRLVAEKKTTSTKNKNKWQKDFYYFVVDTNVLLDHLTFIEDLTKLKLCDTQGSMLYIPYAVLQELDKLKMRSGCQEGVKTLAVRAIKYLNKKFENKSQHLFAQTAVEERDHYIDVNSADDSIINCCLQVKSHVPNLLLLTEDVNLRNKAICNSIMVSTKSDLISKRYDTTTNDDNRRS